jgi:UDPglucose--hexose-1-phosphate uridylyltransferase
MTTPHRRLNLLTGAWVLVSPHRMGRPWQGESADALVSDAPSYDPNCYLCAGNVRVGGVVNPKYEGVWVFDNDFPAILANDETSADTQDPLLVSAPETGICRVICYTPDHAKTMAAMTSDEILAVITVWVDQWHELSARPDIGAITIFENRGAMMGASNPHPHGQIWATSSVPHELALECERQSEYFEHHGRPLLIDYVERELAADERIVFANDSFVVLVPFWAAWPFETMILPRRAIASLDEASPSERADLAAALAHLTRTYDGVFNAPFPYTMGLHQRPTQAPAIGFVFHMHFYPPLLRSATVRKFMVGFEMLAMAQRDLTPEAAAARLREVLVVR